MSQQDSTVDDGRDGSFTRSALLLQLGLRAVGISLRPVIRSGRRIVYVLQVKTRHSGLRTLEGHAWTAVPYDCAESFDPDPDPDPLPAAAAAWPNKKPPIAPTKAE